MLTNGCHQSPDFSVTGCLDKFILFILIEHWRLSFFYSFHAFSSLHFVFSLSSLTLVVNTVSVLNLVSLHLVFFDVYHDCVIHSLYCPQCLCLGLILLVLAVINVMFHSIFSFYSSNRF